MLLFGVVAVFGLSFLAAVELKEIDDKAVYASGDDFRGAILCEHGE